MDKLLKSSPTTVDFVTAQPWSALILFALALSLMHGWGSTLAQLSGVYTKIEISKQFFLYTLPSITIMALFIVRYREQKFFSSMFLIASGFVLVLASLGVFLSNLEISRLVWVGRIEVIGLPVLLATLLYCLDKKIDYLSLGLALVGCYLFNANLMFMAICVISVLLFSGLAIVLTIRAPRDYWVDLRTLLAILVEYFVCLLAFEFALDFWSIPAVVLASVIVGCRLQALFIIFHDAVHGLIAKNRRVNDFIINLFVGIPTFVLVQVFRPVHLKHHQAVGTEYDPEKILLYSNQPWNYKPLRLSKLVIQFLNDILIVGLIKTMMRMRKELNNPNSKLQLPQGKIYVETWVALAIWIAIITTLILTVNGSVLLKVLTVYLIGFFVVMAFLVKLRSMGEHSLGSDDEVTNSWRAGLLGRLTLWPYHINYHKEHHQCTALKWHELPLAFPEALMKPGFSLWRELYDKGT